MEFINFLFKNWSIPISAPLIFISFLIVSIFLSWLTIHFIYKERIEILNTKSSLKDDLIDEYRQRLHIVDTHNTSYSKLTNKEIKAKAVNLIYQMREYLSKKTLDEDEYKAIIYQEFWKAKSDEERDKILNSSIAPLLQTKSTMNLEYGKKFQSDAILIRDEILLRLPKDQKNDNVYNLYLYLSNPFGLKMVIDDLERLSKSLPN